MGSEFEIVAELPRDPSGYGSVAIISSGVDLFVEFDYYSGARPMIGRIVFSDLEEFTVLNFEKNYQRAPEKGDTVYCSRGDGFNKYVLWINEDIIVEAKARDAKIEEGRAGRLPNDAEDWRLEAQAK